MKTKTVTILATTGVALAGLLVGIGMNVGSGATSPGPSPTTKVDTQTIGKLYVTTFQLRKDIEALTDIRCTRYAELKSPIGAIDRATCSESISLGIFNSKEDAHESAKENGELVAGILGNTSVHLIGENWNVNCGEYRGLCESIQKVLGGELLVIEREHT